jgi:hypothetical protein
MTEGWLVLMPRASGLGAGLLGFLTSRSARLISNVFMLRVT